MPCLTWRRTLKVVAQAMQRAILSSPEVTCMVKSLETSSCKVTNSVSSEQATQKESTQIKIDTVNFISFRTFAPNSAHAEEYQLNVSNCNPWEVRQIKSQGACGFLCKKGV